MFISHNFDSGNIEVLSCDDNGEINLNIRPDNKSEFYQWFHFRLTGAAGVNCRIKLLNAAGAAYPPGFKDYRVVYSYDRNSWCRHATALSEGVLSFEFTPSLDSVYFAYFAPYSMERHHDLIADSLQSPRCRHLLLGQTLDGQDFDLLKLSAPAGAEASKNCWIIGRQHPGESMAQWWMEGCIEYLLDEAKPLSNKLLQQCNFYLVANMNPDGSRRGHLRTNACGRNLNREWAEPSLTYSPEVYYVKEKMAETGVDFMLDVHGDESLPYCFIAGTEGLSNWDAPDQERLDYYKNTLAELNPDFQTQKGYPPKARGTANLSMSTVQTAANHGCLAMTLEMPFKDTTATTDEKYGWSPARCKLLAHSCLEALADSLERNLI